ncbi:DENN domain-containing protein 2C [Spea bombifrons]|uniref:DENN domain-containing protein 2C n=1 Tax=Spea bombifrons TaxID=233779 RepID=UPI002349AB2D|nr:DENN domain-containing protein 2C [Spea bombifrons]
MPVMHTMGSPECGLSRSALQTLSRSHCKNIKQKISQWEGRSITGSCGDLLSEKPSRTFSNTFARSTAEGLDNRKHGLNHTKHLGLDFREETRGDLYDGENNRLVNEEAESPTIYDQQFSDPEMDLPPGNFYTSAGMFKKSNYISEEDLTAMVMEFKRKRGKNISKEKELNLRGLANQITIMKSMENIYCDSGHLNAAPSINPVPKPRRTFRYSTEHRHDERKDNHHHRRRRSVDESDTESSDPSAPPSEPKKPGNRKLRPRSKRKSFEFEDVQTYRRFLQNSNHPQISEESTDHSRPAVYHTVSEENIYEDIMYPVKEHPYEDIKISPLPLWRAPSIWKLPPPRCTIKAPKIPSKPNFLKRQTLELKSTKLYLHKKTPKDSTLPVTLMEWKIFRSGGDTAKKRKKFPRLVMKIQDIFEAKRGKKRVKVQTYVGQFTPSSKGEASESESETEDRQRRHKRLTHVQSSLKRNPHYQTLERDLIEFQEQQLFELFVVVSLQKKPSGDGYIPYITQQYPNKNDQPLRQSKDTEERLKVIPQFCFPDSKDWAPTSDLKSETFSFVLTGEDGSRWFGYCKKLLPQGKGKRLPEVYCMVSRLGCFNLFSKILDEVEKRREMSPALVSPFMRSVMEAPFPAPGRTITVKSFLPGSGNEVIELCRPMDSRLEHVDFDCLFNCLSVSHLIKVFASLLLERRVIFVADNLSTLSKCAHAVVALLYPFTWQHTYIPVLPASMIDIVCSPTPFLIGILSCSLPLLSDLPIEEVLIVDLCANKFLQQLSDEDDILPHKLQAALVQILEQRNDIIYHEQHFTEEDVTLNSLVTEAFVWFFVEIMGHYSLHMYVNEKGERVFQRDPFRKSHTSRSIRQFLDLFMETQMFAGFTQDRELRKSGVKGVFEVRAIEYLKTLPETEPSSVNKFLKGLSSKMKFLQKK